MAESIDLLNNPAQPFIEQSRSESTRTEQDPSEQFRSEQFRSDQPKCRQLARLVMQEMPGTGIADTAIPGLALIRANSPTNCVCAVYQPALCVVAQGSKTVKLGDREILYGPLTYMVSAIDLPVTGKVISASEEEPYLAVKIAIDPKEVAEMVLQIGDAVPARRDDCRYAACGLSIAPVDFNILDAMTRLVQLLQTPGEASFLAPLIRKEIIYRALIGEMGSRMRDFAMADGQAHRIARVIEILKFRFAEPLRVRELAETANMSESTLYHTFKEVTRMSPVQYQKQLRLHEARRLMLSEGLEASTASYRVGYESPSHFSREYSRMFGAPPKADVMKLRGMEQRAS